MNSKITLVLKDDLRADKLTVASTAADITFYIVFGSAAIVDGVAFFSKNSVNAFNEWFKNYAQVSVNFDDEHDFATRYTEITQSMDPYFASVFCPADHGAKAPRVLGIGHLENTTITQGPKNLEWLATNLEKVHQATRKDDDRKRSYLVINKSSALDTQTTGIVAAQATAIGVLNDFQLDENNTLSFDLNKTDGSYIEQSKRREVHYTEHFDKLIEKLDNLGIKYALDVDSSFAIYISPIDTHHASYIKKYLKA